MEEAALHLEVRNAIALSDELGRHEHPLGNDTLAGHLAAVRTTLAELERDVGLTHAHHQYPLPTTVESIERSLCILRDRSEEVPMTLRPRLGQLMAMLERVMFAELRPSLPVPAKTVAGQLPIKRVIPQNAHSVIDYLAAGAYFASAAVARTPSARIVGAVLGTKLGGVSALTDCQLSARRVISIERHEVIDHASGIAAVTAPLVLGYARRDPIASALQIAAGLATIAVSLFTDFRATRGIGPARRSRGGPKR
jgi:hypothetical protein